MSNNPINIEEIMQSIRQEIREKHLTSDMLSFQDVPFRRSGGAVNGCTLDSEEIRSSMVYLNAHYQLQPYKPLYGNALFVFVKKVIRRLVKFYIEPIMAEQSEFNANAVRVLNAVQQSAQSRTAEDPAALLHRLEVLELQQKQLSLRLEALQQENAALRAEIGRQA